MQMLKILLIITGIVAGVTAVLYLIAAAACLKMRYEDQLLD